MERALSVAATPSSLDDPKVKTSRSPARRRVGRHVPHLGRLPTFLGALLGSQPAARGDESPLQGRVHPPVAAAGEALVSRRARRRRAADRRVRHVLRHLHPLRRRGRARQRHGPSDRLGARASARQGGGAPGRGGAGRRRGGEARRRPADAARRAAAGHLSCSTAGRTCICRARATRAKLRPGALVLADNVAPSSARSPRTSTTCSPGRTASSR